MALNQFFPGKSHEKSIFVEIYDFMRDLLSWQFTSSDRRVVYDGKEYASTQIERTAIQSHPDILKNNLTLTFPRNHPFAREFIGFTPEAVTTIQVRVLDISTDP